MWFYFKVKDGVPLPATATLGTLRGRGPSLAMGGAAKRRLGGLMSASNYIGEFLLGVGQGDGESLLAGGGSVIHGIVEDLLANRA